MIIYNNVIINPKNIDFVKTYLGNTVQVFFANSEKCEIHTENIDEATELIYEIYEQMYHYWIWESKTK